MTSRDRTRRLQLCLALYVLFAFIPGLHGALHPLIGSDASGAGVDLAEISAACPDGCADPEHRHLSPSHECPVCKTGWSPNALPQSGDRGLPAAVPGASLALRGTAPHQSAELRTERARAPPQSPVL